jgi:hypothetical protein
MYALIAVALLGMAPVTYEGTYENTVEVSSRPTGYYQMIPSPPMRIEQTRMYWEPRTYPRHYYPYRAYPVYPCPFYWYSHPSYNYRVIIPSGRVYGHGYYYW